MAALKTFLFSVLRKYRIDPENFSGTLDFEIEIKNGDVRVLHHRLTKTPAALN